MYNRYYADDAEYRQVGGEQPPHAAAGWEGNNGAPLGGLGSLLNGLLGGGKGGERRSSVLSGLLNSLGLEDLDTGDILLLLILLLLVLDSDGDDLELIITLGLVVLFGLNGKSKKREREKQDAEKPADT
ncbi:MAG: hypothetical protein LKK00_09985 [Intestinimonas sp.]|nr:hypothetical protein [Intestinimonas sp.]